MQWVASGFLFVRRDTVVHRLDPRVRLLISFALFIIALLSHSIVELGVLISITLSTVAAARILGKFAKSMVLTLSISAIAFALNFVFNPRSPHDAIVFGVRLFAVISATSLFFLTSTPDELEQVMKWLRFPSDFVMIFVIAVRFVPVLLLDALQIMDAQRSRGLEFDKGNFIQRLRNSIPIVVPLIAVALNRSLDLAEAMDSRAYGATKRPTSLYHLSLKRGDFIAVLILLVGFILGTYTALYVPLF
ncbi:MAG: energy-coupling factor transporter transmembrane protein EcfT [Thaumarchaeota archaeon]|nr:energy-coupling factor transporter transmembrane protein EcfT [Nitrososphaerota archaeon]